MISKISELNHFNVYAINRVRLELESLCGSNQFFDVELTKPEDAGIMSVNSALEAYRKRIATLQEHQFEFTAKLTVMSAGGSAVMRGDDFGGIAIVFEMASKLFHCR